MRHLQQLFHHRKSSAANARGPFVVNLTPWLLPTAKESTSMEKPHIRFAPCAVDRNLFPQLAIDTSIFWRSARSLVTIVTELSVFISKFHLHPPTVTVIVIVIIIIYLSWSLATC